MESGIESFMRNSTTKTDKIALSHYFLPNIPVKISAFTILSNVSNDIYVYMLSTNNCYKD